MKSQNIPINTPVKVLWVDSVNHGGWFYANEGGRYDLEPEPQSIATIGFVVACSPEGLMVSNSLTGAGAMLSPLTIPWGCVKSLKALRGEKEDK